MKPSRRRLVESPFLIEPGEVRRVRFRFDGWPEMNGSIVVPGFMTTDPGFEIVAAHAGDRRMYFHQIPADVDPYLAELTCCLHTLPIGQEMLLLVENIGDHPARFRARLR